MTDLEKLLKETEDKYNFIENIKLKLPFDDEKRLIVYSTDSVHYDLIDYDKEKSINLLFDIENAFPANKDNYIIEFSGRETIGTMHPVQIKIHNVPVEHKYNPFYVELSYYSEDLKVVIKLNINRFDKFLKETTRKISVHEHHYFPHISVSKLRKLTVKAYELNKLFYPNLKSINWIGGDKTIYADNLLGKKEFEDLLLFNIY